MTELTEESLIDSELDDLDFLDEIDWVNESFKDDDFGSILED